MAELFYKKDTESDYLWLYILDKGHKELVESFRDSEEMLFYIEKNFDKAILYVN